MFTCVYMIPLARSYSRHESSVEVKVQSQLERGVYSRNGPFALTGHMVQNPPYWMAKECDRFGHKGIPTCQA